MELSRLFWRPRFSSPNQVGIGHLVSGSTINLTITSILYYIESVHIKFYFKITWFGPEIYDL